MLAVDYSLIEHLLNNNIRFAAYCLPGIQQFKVIIQHSDNICELSSLNNIEDNHGFVFAPFDLGSKHKIIIINDDSVLNEGDEIHASLLNIPKEKASWNNSLRTPYFSSKEDYLNQFDDFHNLLSVNALQKIILSRVLPHKVNANFKASSLFQELNRSYKSAFTYIINTPETGCWLGASPEQLLKISNGSATTVSLAGTQENKHHNTNKVSWGNKELTEQNIVTEYIQEILSNYVDKKLIKKNTETVTAGKIVHRQTLFSFPSARIGKNIGSFISQLHPTPAVCGLPKAEALENINKTEMHDREYYSGFLGLINMDEATDLFVNLRCLKVHDDQLALYAGGGLTIDSDPEKEWEETGLKANTLLSILNKLNTSNYELS